MNSYCKYFFLPLILSPNDVSVLFVCASMFLSWQVVFFSWCQFAFWVIELLSVSLSYIPITYNDDDDNN